MVEVDHRFWLVAPAKKLAGTLLVSKDHLTWAGFLTGTGAKVRIDQLIEASLLARE